MEDLLGRMGLHYEFIEAVDGNTVSESAYLEMRQSSIDWARKYSRKPLSRGEVGCLLSHLQAYEKILADNIDYACIMEDDVVIHHPDNLRWVLQAEHLSALNERTPFDLIYLYLGFQRFKRFNRWRQALFPHVTDADLFSRWPKIKAKPGLYLSKPCHNFWGAVAYLVNRDACSALLQQGRAVHRPVDVLTACATLLGLRQYYLNPLPVGVLNTMPSTIIDEGRFFEHVKFDTSYWRTAIAFACQKAGIISLHHMLKKLTHYD